MPEEAVVTGHVTDGTTVSYMRVGESYWDIFVGFSSLEFPNTQAAVSENLTNVVERVETYNSSDTFAVLERAH